MKVQNDSTSISLISFSPEGLMSNRSEPKIEYNPSLSIPKIPSNNIRSYIHKRTLKKINMNILVNNNDNEKIEKEEIYDFKSIGNTDLFKNSFYKNESPEKKINYNINNKYIGNLYGKSPPKNHIEMITDRIFDINKQFKKEEIIINNKINIGDKNQKNLGDLKGRLKKRGIVPKNVSKEGFKKSINNLYTRIKKFKS
jgi:hypothetical protein